jgi:predicted RNA-binding Zn-ribbon protein involved in translation (DUF1610 family)
MALRDVILRLMPRGMRERAIQESKEWFVICPSCGHARSYWEIGGLRYKASSRGKRTGHTCSQCGKWSMHRVERRAVDQPT